MVTLDNEIRLANLLIALGDGEQDIEATREKLSKMNDFDPYLLFKFLDKSSKGYLMVPDFLQAFDDLGILLSADQVSYIFAESSVDNKLSFDQ